MKKILFINNNQFGYSTDYFKYCEYLKNRYDITYLCFDKNMERVELENVNIKYVSYSGNKIIRGIRFYIYVLITIFFFKGFIFISYFPGFEYIKILLPWKRMHIDIRTLSVNKDEKKRKLQDSKIKKTVKIYDSVSAVSKGVINKMKSTKKIYLLPLGADIISESDKKFDSMHLIYVGTLVGRDIIKTVKAVDLFVKKHKDITLRYDIIGVGEYENDIINKYIKNHNLSEIVITHGRVQHGKLKPYFDKSNIGVSFIPITDYYDCQPPTKTFEYAFSGLYTIATKTSANMEIITNDNGVLINDTIQDFCASLEYIMEHKHTFSSKLIRSSVDGFSWKNIIENYLVPIIES